jgi:hypothetical protein
VRPYRSHSVLWSIHQRAISSRRANQTSPF